MFYVFQEHIYVPSQTEKNAKRENRQDTYMVCTRLSEII